MRYEHILSRALSTPWAIEPAYADRIASLLVSRVIAGAVSQGEIAAAVGERRDASLTVTDGVGVARLYGPIFPKANMMTESSGATSAEDFASLFEALCRSSDVSAVVIDCDSPGGSTDGVAEAYDRMLSAKADSGKTVVAVSSYMMCSAAYFLCCAADEIVVSPSSFTGGIGVFAIHESVAEALKDEGIPPFY